MFGTVRLHFALLLICALALHEGSARADELKKVDLLLVLAIDVSRSVTEERLAVQREGYAAAFQSREVLDAITSGRYQAIAATYVVWSAPNDQRQIGDWNYIASEEAAREFASLASEMPRLMGSSTSIGGALSFSARLMEGAPFIATRKIIDISGDGAHNSGLPLEWERATVLARGITINGLPILGSEGEISEYYRDNVIGGDGAFMVTVTSPHNREAFKKAIILKLVREIASLNAASMR